LGLVFEAYSFEVAHFVFTAELIFDKCLIPPITIICFAAIDWCSPLHFIRRALTFEVNSKLDLDFPNFVSSSYCLHFALTIY
jgi:hypothetical protein